MKFIKKHLVPTFFILLISTVALLFAHGNMAKATIGFLRVTGISTFTGAQTFTGLTTHGGNVVSDTDGTDDLGTTSVRWDQVYADELFANKGADVASAASSFTLGSDGNYYDITGTTGIDSIAAQTVGKVVALQFDGTLTITDGGNLKLIGDFVSATGATLVLQSDGVDWFELSRAGGSYVNLGLFEYGVDGTALDVRWFSDTAGDNMLYDTSGERLIITGTDGQNALEIPDGDVSITDATTLTGGVLFATMSTVIWSKGGSVALATSGTDQAPTSGPRQWVEVQIPYNVTLTGIGYLVGGTGGTDSVVCELYDSAGTIAVRSIAGDANIATLVATTAEFQKVPFTSTYAAVAGTYYISVQFNGTTARLRTFPIPNSPFVANTAAGTFKTGASITPGTTFVASEGPISFVY